MNIFVDDHTKVHNLAPRLGRQYRQLSLLLIEMKTEPTNSTTENNPAQNVLSLEILPGVKPLNATETKKLQQAEEVIARGMKTFVEVGNALMEIRDNRLYRVFFNAFEDYCRERWGMSKTHANRKIQAAAAVGLLKEFSVKPLNEYTARALAVLPPADARKLWKKSLELAPDPKKGPSATMVFRLRQEMYPGQTFEPLGPGRPQGSKNKPKPLAPDGPSPEQVLNAAVKTVDAFVLEHKASWKRDEAFGKRIAGVVAELRQRVAEVDLSKL